MSSVTRAGSSFFFRATNLDDRVIDGIGMASVGTRGPDSMPPASPVQGGLGLMYPYRPETMASRAQIEADVLAIVKRVARRSVEPTLTSELAADLGYDSLLLLELIAELEEHFNISIPTANELPAVRTVADVIDHIADAVSGGEPAR